jgi:hypothetical protein
MFTKTQSACSKRIIGDLDIFKEGKDEDWEKMYQSIMDPKYKKQTRNFSRIIHGKSSENPKIFLIPRERGGPSYKETKLKDFNNNDLQYCPISKGYSMQDVSSFSLGPVVGEGLCIVNSAFSKAICVMHIEGNGKLNLKRKSYWQRSKNILRKIEIINSEEMKVDNITVNIKDWLTTNKSLWFDEWKKWSQCIALTSVGDFHWNDDTPTLGYWHGDKYLNFVDWKKECYIKPAYELIPKTNVYMFMNDLYSKEKISLGLVHPKAMEGEEDAITKEYIRELYDSKTIMCCMPYCVAGLLLGVEI